MMSEIQFPASPDEIHDRRAEILAALCRMDKGFSDIPVRSIKESTLDAMLYGYDALFFQGALCRAYGSLSVTLSPRLLSAAGKFVYSKSPNIRLNKAEIRMSGDFLTRLEYGPFFLNGLTVSTPQEAFLLVFEHELCHALEIALYGETGHSRRFLSLANKLFGHTEMKHKLPTRKTEAALDGITVGARCSFMYQDQSYSGQITYVGKTATVMVQSATGEYRDKRGRRYAKYRVPLERLTLK